MGAMGMSQGDMLKVHLAQARGERTTLEGRVKVTSDSITTLETALKGGDRAPSELVDESPTESLYRLVAALIFTNLTQLKANLDEGMARIEYLDKSIKTMEAQQSGLITNPSMVMRRPGRG